MTALPMRQNCVKSGGDFNLHADQKDCGLREENWEGYRESFCFPLIR